MNRYTRDYIVNDLLRDVSDDIRDATDRYLRGMLAMDEPPLPTGRQDRSPVQARRHNPMTISTLFQETGFSEPIIHGYNFHPTLPLLERKGVNGESFRCEAIRMEENPQDPRGYFLCAAFVVEAVCQ